MARRVSIINSVVLSYGFVLFKRLLWKAILILIFVGANSICNAEINAPLSFYSAASSDTTAPKFRKFASNYCNPYVSVGVGFDRAFYMPAFGLKGGRVMLQASALPRKNNTQLVTSVNFDLGKNHLIEQGFVRALASITYYRYDLDDPKTSALGLLVGFSSYSWNGRNSLHGKFGVAAKPTDTAFGQVPKNDYQAFIVASICVNFYAFRLPHFEVVD